MNDDLIKRSDAAEVVYKALKTPPLKGVLTDTMSLAIALVRDISSADRPTWIPCKERLPKEYDVLCCDIYRNCIVGHPFADNSASTGFCAESEGEFMYECVAWMPLPKPYGERKEGIDDEVN